MVASVGVEYRTLLAAHGHTAVERAAAIEVLVGARVVEALVEVDEGCDATPPHPTDTIVTAISTTPTRKLDVRMLLNLVRKSPHWGSTTIVGTRLPASSEHLDPRSVR